MNNDFFSGGYISIRGEHLGTTLTGITSYQLFLTEAMIKPTGNKVQHYPQWNSDHGMMEFDIYPNNAIHNAVDYPVWPNHTHVPHYQRQILSQIPLRRAMGLMQ